MIDFVLGKDLEVMVKNYGFSKFIKVRVSDFSSISKNKTEGLVVVEADEKNLRKTFESKHVDLVIGLEKVFMKDDLHYVKSGLNQVLCKLAVKNKISVGFSFTDVLNSGERGKMMGRMIQNIKLCKKYKVNLVFGSFAKDKWDLRWRKDLEAFGRLIGIDKFDNKKIFKLKEDNDIKVIG